MKQNIANMAVVISAMMTKSLTNSFILQEPTLPEVPGRYHEVAPLLEQDCGLECLTPLERLKLKEMQLLDKFNPDDQRYWDVDKVLDHKSINRLRRRPGTVDSVVQHKHVRVKVEFATGKVQWISMVAARGQDVTPLVLYAKQKRLTTHPEWAWTKQFDDEKLPVRIRALQTKLQQTPKFQFGIQVPRSVRHALALDRINGNNLWKESMEREMAQLADYQTFRLPEPGEDLDQYQTLPYHMVFAIKYDGRHKSRLVCQGNKALVTPEDVYSGVVGIETIRTVMAMASMRGLQVCAADIGNAFLYADNPEKTKIIAGPEFGDLEGQTLIVQGAWYGQKTAAAAFHGHLSSTLRGLGFKPSRADMDLWYRERGGTYEYLASYVDDVIVISHDPMFTIEQLKKSYVLKGVGIPEYYLGGNFDQVSDPELLERKITNSLSAHTYIANMVEKFERNRDRAIRLWESPMLEGDHPEEDLTDLLNDKGATLFRAIIGSLNWVVTLGRFDVMYATNTLARFSMQPRVGHLDRAFRVIGYLKRYPNGRLLVNPNAFDLDVLGAAPKQWETWKEFYPDVELPTPDDPPPLLQNNNKVQVSIFVDADHAHCTVTRRSVSCIMVFLNGMPVKWYSKMQKTVETSTYGSELVAARIATDIALEYRYNIRMLGFEIDGPIHLFGDNNAVVLNTTIPSSQLKKKHAAVAYHRVREMIASGAMDFRHIPSQLNVADIGTKPLGRVIHHRLIHGVLFGDGVPPLFDPGVRSELDLENHD